MSLPAVGEIACDDLKERLFALEKLLSDPLSDCYIERLLDVVIASVNDTRFLPQTKENEHSLAFYKRFAHVAALLQSYRRKPQDFSLIASLGHGAFGRVQLVREVTTGRVCAMKVLKKSHMLTQHTDYWIEREIMAHGDSPWIVQLYHAFQDVTSLYMVMEYVPGGNLVCWMEEVEIISEAACRFYAAETVLALTDLHAMGFIHRDLKPDNLLLDVGGHVKLADFGTAVRVDPNTLLVHCDAAVGTPDYLSPEVLLSQGAGGGSYGFEVDWWALGVLVYEMLYGDTPFYSETLVNTYAKIMSHSSHLRFPDGVNISDLGVDFMKQLLRDHDSRLGSGPDGSVRVCSHPWFSPDWASAQKSLGLLDSSDVSLVDWSWANIRACRAPFQPRLTSETDTSYFQLESDEWDQHHTCKNSLSPKILDRHLPVSGNADSLDHPTGGLKEAEHFLTRFPGVQLAFAGFSFSSVYPGHLSLLSGLRVAQHSFTLSLNPSNPFSPLVNGIATTDSAGSPHLTIHNGDPSSQSCLYPPPPDPAHTEHPVLNEPAALKCHLARVQSQLDDALLIAEFHSSKVIDLSQQLERSDTLRRELESQLAQRDVTHRLMMEEAERRAESVQIEVRAKLARLEAELTEWKAIAHSKKMARVSQQDTGCTTLDLTNNHLSIRSAEVVDSAAASEVLTLMPSSTSSSLDISAELRTPVSMTCSALSPDHVAFPSLFLPDVAHLNEPSSVVNSPPDRINQLARRAHRAEVHAREVADLLEAEQHFCRLYKETSAEKSDQLKELTRELVETRELLSASQNNSRRHYEECEAARRALEEEQLRSRRHREVALVAEERSISASKRTAAARREAANLRDSLELMKQAYEKERSKCVAAVNKLTEVMSGSSTGALELMYIASAAQSKDANGTFYLGNAASRHKLALIFGNRQQQQISNQAREIKRLLNEIKRLNAELAMSRRVASLAGVDSTIDDSHFHPLPHSLENRNDLATTDVHHSTPSSTVQLRSRTGLFGRRKTNLQSEDIGMVLSSMSKSVVGAEPEDALASSSSETSSVRTALPRLNSSGEPFPFVESRTITQIETLPSISNPFSPDRDDFTLAGVLELGRRQPRRKKFFWSPRVVKLTSAHLTIWEYTPDTITILDSDSRHSVTLAQNLGNLADSTSSSRTLPSAVLEVPIRALYHIRQLDQSDAIHERPEDLATVFSVAYDRFFSDHSLSDSMAGRSELGVGGLQNSLTLPHKPSFGSAAHFTTAYNPHPLITDTSPQYFGDPVNRKHPVIGSSNGHLDNVTLNHPDSNFASSSKTQSISISPHVILVRGHRLHHIRFPRMAVCDLCRKACWKLVSPPPAFQCIRCQLKFHATHLDTQDYVLPTCGKAIVSLVLRCVSSAEREKWVKCMRAAVHRTKVDSFSDDPNSASSTARYQYSTADPCHLPVSDSLVTAHASGTLSPFSPLDDMLHDGDHSYLSKFLSRESGTADVMEPKTAPASSATDSESTPPSLHFTSYCDHRLNQGGSSRGNESVTSSHAY